MSKKLLLADDSVVIQKLVAPRLCRKFYGFASATVDEVIRGDCGIDDDDLVGSRVREPAPTRPRRLRRWQR